MPGLNVHLEEFVLLRYVVGELSRVDRDAAIDHLMACSICGAAQAEIERLDAELRTLAAQGAMDDSSTFDLARADPFYCRPEPLRPASPRTSRSPLEQDAIAAAAAGKDLTSAVLDSAREPLSLASLLSSLDTRRADHRFAVLYALHEAGCKSAEDPYCAMTFARWALGWIRTTGRHDADVELPAELVVPRVVLRAQAHLLLALACLWTTRYSRARAHLIVAYRGFAAGGGDETKLALVELAEAQRRALSREPLPAVALTRRARETFEDRGLDDYAARASVVEGLALYALDRDEDAIRAYREAVPTFESLRLWSNYVGALNSIATSLNRLGRHEEARREYAKALRHFSQHEHRFWLGYLRIGLAESLFAAGHYDEAAVAAARASRIFGDCRLRAQALIALLLEIESWGRHGDIALAQVRLGVFWAEVERDGKGLDRVIVEELGRALAGAKPNFERLASLREATANQIQEIYRTG
jgi:tetratricopeptide (TPR) repeat protein